MFLLAALSAATLVVVVRAAFLPSELKPNKNESEALANSLRNKLMSENYDYMTLENGEPSRSVASYEEQEPAVVHARAHDVSGTRERYEDQKQESSTYIPETDGPQDNLVEIQRSLPVPGDIQDDPNDMMRHDNPKLARNGGDDLGKNKISSHFDGNIKMNRVGYNERDERYLGKESNKYDKLKQSQNDDKHAKSQYNYPGDDNPPQRKDRHDDFKHIDQETDKPAKLIRDTENDQIDKDAKMRREKIDKYKYDKHDDQQLDRTSNRQATFDNMEDKRGNQDRPGDHRNEETSKLKNSKTSDFIQLERDKRIDMRFGKSVNLRYNDLEALKAAKREHDKRNNLRFDKSDHRRPDNFIYDKKDYFRQDEREKFQLNSHENDRLHDVSGDSRNNIRSDEENKNRPYKSRFQKLNNVRPSDLRQNSPDKLTRDNMRQEKSDMIKYNKHDDARQKYLNENKYNQIKQDDPVNMKYGTRDEQKHGENRHDKQTKLNEYDRDVFPQANGKSSKSNLKYTTYKSLRQDDMRYNRHTKRDEMRRDAMKYDNANKRDDFRHEKMDEIRHYDQKKHKLHLTNSKEKKNKYEPYRNDKKQDHIEDIKKMGREHNQIKEKKLRQDYGVDDGYNRQSYKQKLEKPRDKPNESPNDKPRGLLQRKLDTKMIEVPLKYDKLEQQLEKQFQRVNPITESDKENNNKKQDEYIKNRYEKYKRINNEYKYKHKQFNENDKNKRYQISNNRYDKGRPYRPNQRAQVATSHSSEDYVYISEHGNATNGINSVYVPRSRDIDNTNVTADNDNLEQKVPGVSRRDLLYYVDDEKMAGLMGTDDVVDVAGVATVDTRRNAKKYKLLKMVTSGRRVGEGGGGGVAGRVVQEEGAGSVALVALDGGALPSFQLPLARRQYMPSDHDSDYQAGDLLDDVPDLKEYPEPDLTKLDISRIHPPGLTASVQDSYNQLYSPSVDGHITPDKERGLGGALFKAMNVQSILNE